MNTQLNFQRTKTRSPKRLFNFRFAAVLASVCLGVGLLLPVIKNGLWHHHRMPAGQFQADMRTMVAALRYLFDSEPDIEKNPAPFAGSPATFTQRTPERTVKMSDSSSNQTETDTGSATNLAAQT
jgi:hypothetical protein